MSLINRGKKEDVSHITIIKFTCETCMKQIWIVDPEPMDYCPYCGRK